MTRPAGHLRRCGLAQRQTCTAGNTDGALGDRPACSDGVRAGVEADKDDSGALLLQARGASTANRPRMDTPRQLSGDHGKMRCPLRSGSMGLFLRQAPDHLVPGPGSRCCLQQSITVPPSVNAKTAQKHDYASKATGRSYARRTAVERSNSR